MIGFIEVVDMSDADKRELSEEISAATAILKSKAEHFGFRGVRDMRKEYMKNGRRFLDKETGVNFDILLELEELVLSVYGKMASMLAASFFSSNRSKRPHLDESDYIQEASWAIFDCMYCYDGSRELSTYCYSTVKLRLTNFVRTEEVHAGIGRPTKALRTRLRQIMSRRLCGFDEAIAEIRQNEEVSADMEANVRAACYNIRYSDRDEDLRTSQVAEEPSEQVEQLLVAVKNAGLNDLQRELIEEFLRIGERPDTDWYDKINPNTGNKYTRQALSQNWHKACDKVRELMEPVAA